MGVMRKELRFHAQVPTRTHTHTRHTTAHTYTVSTLTHTHNSLHGPETCAVTWSPALKRAHARFNAWAVSVLKFLIFKQEAQHFYFILGLASSAGSPACVHS